MILNTQDGQGVAHGQPPRSRVGFLGSVVGEAGVDLQIVPFDPPMMEMSQFNPTFVNRYPV